jgi:GTPase SAR1 family protein
LCNNKEPDSDAEDEEEEEETEAADEGEEPALADDFVAKIVIVGASGSGKTLLWSRYTRGLVPKVNIPTKDQDEDRFESKDVMVDESGSKEIKLLLWDTSG